jgi:hypothetical protein
MSTKLQFLAFLLISFSLIQAQETTVNTSMGANYSNQVFYKLSTATETSFVANSWDIAFLRTSAFAFSLRINDGVGTKVFEASNSLSDWSTIDIDNESSWTGLYNSELGWDTGAFGKGSATYGWGEYNFSNHHVEGSIIFVLKYTDGSYIKFINEDFSSGYTFTYSKWDSATATWGADQTATVSNTSNPDNTFNYYSLQNGSEVLAEIATADWDLKFTKYDTDYFGDGSLFYNVTGVLQNTGVEIAENDESTGVEVNPSLTYATDINTIGSDWKSYNFSAGTYDVSSNTIFYVKDVDETVYRLYFTSFAGISTGDVSFNFEDVTSNLGFEDVSGNFSFGIYPNPSIDKKVTLVYDINELTSSNNKVVIYSTTGQKVFEQKLTTNSGFYTKTLDLSNLENGIYILVFNSGTSSFSKKIILK